MQREVIKWLQGLHLSTPVRNPHRDMVNGVAAAEIVAFYCANPEQRRPPVDADGYPEEDDADEEEEDNTAASRVRRAAGGRRGPSRPAGGIALNARIIDFTATSAASKRTNWNEVLRVLALMRCKSVDVPLVESVVHLQANAAQALLENLFEFFTGRKLAMRAADPIVIVIEEREDDGNVINNAQRTEGNRSSGGGRGGSKGRARPAKAEKPREGTLTVGNYLQSRVDVRETATFLAAAGEIAAPPPSHHHDHHNTFSAGATSADAEAEALAPFLSAPPKSASNTAAALGMSAAGDLADLFPHAGGTLAGMGDGEEDERLDVLAPAAAVRLQARMAQTRNQEIYAGAKGLAQSQGAIAITNSGTGGGAGLPPLASTRGGPHGIAVDTSGPTDTTVSALAPPRGTGSYTRPTASSLVHAASNPRYEMSLTKPKNAEDQRTERRRNEQIVAQHETVTQTYFREDGPSATAAAAAAERASPAPPHPSTRGEKRSGAKAVTTTAAAAQQQRRPPTLTAILRGPFAANASSRNGGSKTASTAAGPATHRTKRKADHRSRSPAAAGGKDSAATSTAQGDDGAAAGARRIQVNTMPDSLRLALENTGVYAHGEVLAGEKSIQVFQQCGWRLQAATSMVLLDVLQARRELAPLLEMSRRRSAVRRGDDVLLADLLSCFVAHRHELPSATIEACWGALGQNVAGIAATLVHRPSEYRYLLQTFGYAFSAAAARIRLLHVTGQQGQSAADGEAVGGDQHDPTGAADNAPFQRQRAVIRDAEALALACVFIFLTSIGRAVNAYSRREAANAAASGDQPHQQQRPLSPSALDDPAAAPLLLMERYFLPAAQRFILSTGSPAAVEAVVRVIAATLISPLDGTSTTTTTTAVATGAEVSRLVRFLEVAVRGALQRQLSSPATADARYALVAYHTLSLVMPLLSAAQSALARAAAAATVAGQGGGESEEGEESGGGSPRVGPQQQQRRQRRQLAAVEEGMAAAAHYALFTAGRLLQAGNDSAVDADADTDADPTVYPLGVGLLLIVAPVALLTALPAGTTGGAAGSGDRTEDNSNGSATGATGDGAGGGSSSNLMSLVERYLVQPLRRLPTCNTNTDIDNDKDSSSSRASLPQWMRAAGSWEARVLALELLTMLSRRLLLQAGEGVAVAQECREERLQQRDEEEEAGGGGVERGGPDRVDDDDLTDYDDDVAAAAEEATALRCAAARLDQVAVACLGQFTRDGTEGKQQQQQQQQQQLALSIVSRRLVPDLQPALASRWLQVLLSLPSEDFQRCLLPSESEPPTVDITDERNSNHRHHRDANNSSNTDAVVVVGSCDTAAPSPSAAGAAPATPRRLSDTASDASAASTASAVGPAPSIALLSGAVEPSYVVAPLNQSWNTTAVVHLILRRLRTMTAPAAALAVVAAALNSPQPVEAQDWQLAQNLAMLAAAAPARVAAVGADVRRNGETTGSHSEDGEEDDKEELAFTMRDVVMGAMTNDDNDDDGDGAGHPTAALLLSSSLFSLTAPADGSAAAFTAAFWRGALQYLAPVIRSGLGAGTASSRPDSGSDNGNDRDDNSEADGGAGAVASGDGGGDRLTREEASHLYELAASVLFTMFNRCASADEAAAVMADGSGGSTVEPQDTASQLLAWLDGVCE